ncbi:hypothetical protein [Pseudomonas aeruginosa]|uniref:hypothetical protein n=1 Tax=Pseudomonas aeruginosa TaxID=287 RepID=UPI000717B48C|nr:hypothetical protein [Pseudomonas aeruginosa]KRU87629.1 hypothetical protein AN453_05415 [Pseudomonas aeruginosa]
MKELTLYLDDLTPNRLSMKRLTDYLRALATMYGAESAVHFERVKEGSAQLVAYVEDDQYPVVLNQVREVSGGLGPKKAQAAFQKLSELMSEDRTGASLRTLGGAQIFQFPKPQEAEDALRVVKPSSVQGRLYSVGGKDETVPVRLEGANGETLYCEADIEVAENLAKVIFKTVRLEGTGEWVRLDSGQWRLVKLKVKTFTLLEDISFKEAVARLKAAGGVKWSASPDAHSEILGSRG